MVLSNSLFINLIIGVLFEFVVVFLVLEVLVFVLLFFKLFRLLFRLLNVLFLCFDFSWLIQWCSLLFLVIIVLMLRLVLKWIFFRVGRLVGLEIVMNKWLFCCSSGRMVCLVISLGLMMFLIIIFLEKVFRLIRGLLNFFVVECVIMVVLIWLFVIKW